MISTKLSKDIDELFDGRIDSTSDFTIKVWKIISNQIKIHITNTDSKDYSYVISSTLLTLSKQ